MYIFKASSKEEILKHNALEIVLNVLKNEILDNLEIKFKSLSVIRLLIRNSTDKTGLDIVFSNENLKCIESIVNANNEHLGIIGESSRLACYLPLAAKTEQRILQFCQMKMINVITKQLKSEYLIMLNEALLALNILATINYSNISF